MSESWPLFSPLAIRWIAMGLMNFVSLRASLIPLPSRTRRVAKSKACLITILVTKLEETRMVSSTLTPAANRIPNV